jgi:hypothetical protein
MNKDSMNSLEKALSAVIIQKKVQSHFHGIVFEKVVFRETHWKQQKRVQKPNYSTLHEMIVDLNQRWNWSRVIQQNECFVQIRMIMLDERVNLTVGDVVRCRCE